MTLLERLARAHYRDDYPTWPEQWEDRSRDAQAHSYKKAEQMMRVMAVALREGDDLGNGLEARRDG